MNVLLVIGGSLAGAGVLITLAGVLVDMFAAPTRHEGVAAGADDAATGVLTQVAKWLTQMLGRQITKFVSRAGRGQPLRAFGMILLLLGILVLVIGAVVSAA